MIWWCYDDDMMKMLWLMMMIWWWYDDGMMMVWWWYDDDDDDKMMKGGWYDDKLMMMILRCYRCPIPISALPVCFCPATEGPSAIPLWVRTRSWTIACSIERDSQAQPFSPVDFISRRLTIIISSKLSIWVRITSSSDGPALPILVHACHFMGWSM